MGGVARGLADYLGASAAWLRFAFVVLTFVGGLGVIAYLALWVLVPERPAGTAPRRGDHTMRFDSAPAFFGALLILIAISILFSNLSFWSGSVFWAIVFIVGGVALFQRADRADAPPRPGPPGDQWVPVPPPDARRSSDAGDAGGFAPGPADVTPTASTLLPPPTVGPPPSGPGYRGPGGTDTVPVQRAWQPRPAQPRERSVLGRLTIAAALVVVGVLAGLQQTGVWALSGVQIGAAALATVGVGLLVGTLFGRARWLIVIAAMLAAPLFAVAALDLPLDASSGVRTVTPTSVEDVPAAYELGVGELDIDLSDLDIGARQVEVDASVGMGELTITVPEGVGLDLTGRAGLGEIVLLDQRAEGFGIERTTVRAPDPGQGTLEIRAEAGLGAITVDTVQE